MYQPFDEWAAKELKKDKTQNKFEYDKEPQARQTIIGRSNSIDAKQKQSDISGSLGDHNTFKSGGRKMQKVGGLTRSSSVSESD